MRLIASMFSFFSVGEKVASSLLTASSFTPSASASAPGMRMGVEEEQELSPFEIPCSNFTLDADFDDDDDDDDDAPS